MTRLVRASWRALPPPARNAVRDAFSSTGSVEAGENVFSLTLDDGPDRTATPAVLDALARAGWRATFFLLVERAEANADIVRRIVRDGHEVGLHATTHLSLPTLAPLERAKVIWQGKRRLEAVAGTTVHTFRPPYGQLDILSFVIARARGLEVIAWSASAEDWIAQPTNEIVERLVHAVERGAFVLAHDGLVTASHDPPAPSAESRAEWLTQAIGRLSAEGFRSMPVREILGVWPARRFPWFAPHAA